MSPWKYTNPNKFMSFSEAVLPILSVLSFTLILTGLIWGFFFTPDDFRQGSTVKIIYLHVPAALVAINTWFVMLIGSLVWIVRRHHISSLIAKSAAPIGLTMTLVTLATGAIWGKPMWGTFWAWDPRLTSFAVLLMFYIGYLSIWVTMEYNEKVADLSALLCIIGSIFALLSRYAVLFWSQGLHQGASLSLDKEENISNVFYFPLLVCLLAFFSFFITILLIRIRTEIRARRTYSLKRIN